jgi:hypothetical protein
LLSPHNFLTQYVLFSGCEAWHFVAPFVYKSGYVLTFVNNHLNGDQLLITTSVLSKPFFFWDKADNQGLIPRGGLANGAGWESSSGDGYRYALRGALANNGNAVTMIGSLRGGTMENNQVEGWIGFRIDQVAQKAELSLPQMPNVVLVNAGCEWLLTVLECF